MMPNISRRQHKRCEETEQELVEYCGKWILPNGHKIWIEKKKDTAAIEIR